MKQPFSSLTKQSIKQIADSGTIFTRGEGYFRSGSVNRLWVEDNKLFARVFGGHGEYNVVIEDDNGKLSCNCTCPYEGERCKHIVAALLAFLDQKDNLLALAKQKKDEHGKLQSQLLALDKADLAKLLVRSLGTHKDWRSTLLKELSERFKKGTVGVSQKIFEEQFSHHFNRVCGVLQEFNEYGGGPEEEESDVYDGLEEIVKFFKEGNLGEKTKRQFIDKMFYYYDWDNSGLTDVIMDAIFDVAKTKEDWEYIIEKLKAKKEDSDLRQNLIIGIYRDHLKDDQKYLELRQKDLRWGGDYYDLARYWHKKGDVEKAISIAKEGIERFNHGTDELLEYLFKHYKSKDYATALEYLKKIFEQNHQLEQYRRLQKFARKEDWNEIDQWCRNVLSKEKESHELARIYRFNKEYDKVLEYVLSANNNDWVWDDGERTQYAGELIGRYPNELVPFYAKRVERHIERMGRKDYQKAAHYAKTLKEIYCKYLNQKESWDTFITGIRKTYPGRKALLEEFAKL